MKIAVFNKDKNISIKSTIIPKILDTNVLIKVKASGICGSDLVKIKDENYPLEGKVIGHEFTGMVNRIGRKVTNITIGQKVVVNPVLSCGRCKFCQKQVTQLCENIKIIGRDIQGGFSEYIVVPCKQVHKLPSNLSYHVGTLADLMACSYHTYNLCEQPYRQKIAIVGDGPFALCLGLLYRSFGNKVTILGKHIYNMDIARELNFTNVVLSRDYGIKLNESYDVVIEAVGGAQSETFNIAGDLLKPRGILLSGGVYNIGYCGKVEFRKLFYKEPVVIGVNSQGFWLGKSEFEQGLKLLTKFQQDCERMITLVKGLDSLGRSLEKLLNKEDFNLIKVVHML